MKIISRPYADVSDLHKIQAATAEWTALIGNYVLNLHTGDITHRLFNGMRKYDACDLIRLWEDTEGSLCGWGLVYPRWNAYEVSAHPNHRDSDLLPEIIEWAEAETWRWMQKEGRSDASIQLEILEDDTTYIQLLERRGYHRTQHQRFVSSRSLDEPIPGGQLPAGFHIRSVAGAHEVEKVVEVQNRSFGWNLIPEVYGRFMESPGYNAQNQLVVVAADGHFAAVCTTFIDDLNKVGMFEDVGTHAHFRQMGLARAMLYHGMQQMKMRGMTKVLVPHRSSEENKAAFNLYYHVGFRPAYTFYGYEKTMSNPMENQ